MGHFVSRLRHPQGSSQGRKKEEAVCHVLPGEYTGLAEDSDFPRPWLVWAGSSQGVGESAKHSDDQEHGVEGGHTTERWTIGLL